MTFMLLALVYKPDEAIVSILLIEVNCVDRPSFNEIDTSTSHFGHFIFC